MVSDKMGESETDHQILTVQGAANGSPALSSSTGTKSRMGPESILESHCPETLQQGAVLVLEL